MADKSQNVFTRLTSLFRSGPVIKRRVKNYQGTGSSSAFEIFRKTQSHVYSNAMSAYGSYDRMARYSDFSEMEYTPEISSALDIYSEETVAADDKGTVLHIFSENNIIQRLLEDLFYDTLNIDFNLTAWTRNLCKYGDFFLFNDVSEETGVINVYPIPTNEIEREEGFDPQDPLAVRFRWATQGNQVLENWQVSHFRLLGNDAFLPYGSSVLEAARRIWRQLILIEDAMLVYRVIRSPERRVFYVDVGNVPPEEIQNYMEQAQTTLKRSQVVDRDTGRVDLRYNPLSVDEDYFLPVRGSESGTRIETLAGGANTTAIEDVEYIQKKLFAALKIPKAYLGYDEGLGAKATLSQEDIRFSRTINRIQRTVISELNKIAIIHLYCHGFDGEDLLDFELQLSNPSTIAQQQKLELYRTKFEIAGAPPEGMVDREWIRKNVLGLTDDEIKSISRGRISDRESDLRVETVKLPEETGTEVEEVPGADTGDAPMPDLGIPDLAEIQVVAGNGSIDLLDVDEIDEVSFSISDEDAPIKAQNRMDSFVKTLGPSPILESDEDDEDDSDEMTYREREQHNRRRRVRFDGRSIAKGPPKHDQKGSNDNTLDHPYGNPKDLVNPLRNIGEIDQINDSDLVSEFWDDKISQHTKMTSSLRTTLKSLESKIGNNSRRTLMSEALKETLGESDDV